MSSRYQNLPMLARTHGQAASPTRLGKEIQVFSERVKQQMSLLRTTLMLQNLEVLLEILMHIILLIPILIGRSLEKILVVNTLGLHHSFFQQHRLSITINWLPCVTLSQESIPF